MKTKLRLIRLAMVATGIVKEVDYEDGKFWFTFVPEHQWRKDSEGNWQACEVRHSYCLSESYLVAATE